MKVGDLKWVMGEWDFSEEWGNLQGTDFSDCPVGITAKVI